MSRGEHHRHALGPADVCDERLAAMVADQLGVPHVELLDSSAEVVAYELPAITTASRHWVRGHALVDGARRSYAFFVKHVQSWAHSPVFALAAAVVPPDQHQAVIDMVPWRTEPLVYRSDLRERLPDGLEMPRVFAVVDLPEDSAAIWLEAVPVEEVTWDEDRYARAAHLLGRLAASERVRPLAGVGGHSITVQDYARGRLAHFVLPMLRGEEIWHHPLVAGAFDDVLRSRLQAAADRVESIVAELTDLPVLTAHGDACPHNLLVAPGVDGFVLIDFGFWSPLPAGFDLGQLLVGDVQLGRRPSGGPDGLAALDERLVENYVRGLRAEGSEVAEHQVRRGHALSLLLYTGLSSLPFELLDHPPSPELAALAADRAAIARFSLDLVDATA